MVAGDGKLFAHSAQASGAAQRPPFAGNQAAIAEMGAQSLMVSPELHLFVKSRLVMFTKHSQ